MRRLRSLSFASALALSAAACGGATATTVAPRPEARSPVVERFLAAGGPPLDRAWSLAEHERALGVLARQAEDDWTLAPRLGDAGSRALFERMIGHEPLALLEATPPAERAARVARFDAAFADAYAVFAGQGPELGDDELVELTGARLRLAAVSARVEATAEGAAAPTEGGAGPEGDEDVELEVVPPTDPAEALLDAAYMLVDEDLSDPVRPALLGHLNDSGPAIVAALPPDHRAPLVAEIERALASPVVAAHADATTALLSSLRAAAR